MTGAIATPRYSNDDFETASVRSAAPSYGESTKIASIASTLQGRQLFLYREAGRR